jgi:hypothetical protein
MAAESDPPAADFCVRESAPRRLFRTRNAAPAARFRYIGLPCFQTAIAAILNTVCPEARHIEQPCDRMPR